MTNTTNDNADLVNADELLETLWKPNSRPSARWLRDRTLSGEVPCVKLGGLVFYSVEQVRAVFYGVPAPTFKTVDLSPEGSREEYREAARKNRDAVERAFLASEMQPEA